MKWIVAVIGVLLVLSIGTANALGAGDNTRHFDITYSGGVKPSGASGLGRVLEDSYHIVNGYFGTCPPGHIKVLVVGKKAMDEIGEHVEAFSAWNNKSSAIVLRDGTLKDKKSLAVVTKHEITHLALNNILEKKDCKQFEWMQEGICMVVSEEPLSDVKISKYILSKGFMKTSEIQPAVDNDSYDISKDGYMQSYSLVKYITQRYGLNAIINMLECPETNFEKAFLMCTGEDFPTFYKEWQQNVSLTAAYQPQKSNTSLYGYNKNFSDEETDYVLNI